MSSVEREVALLREQQAMTAADATAARVLAAGADRDVSEVRAELRAHTQSLNALRATQVEFGRALVEQGREMQRGFATVTAGITEIVERLDDGAAGR